MKGIEKENNRNQYKKAQRIRKLMIISGWFLCVAVFAAGGFSVLGISGKYNLERQTINYAVERDNGAQAVPEMMIEKTLWQGERDGYEERNYIYNNDIITFLLMGINKEREIEGFEEYTDGGQAETLLLIILNPHEEVIKLIPIYGNTMTTINIYSSQGVFENTILTQVGNQYGFGKDEKENCEYQVKAVRNLLYGIPISGYLAVNMEDIPKMIGLIDGIAPEMLEVDSEWNGSVELSINGRLERQGRFLAELIIQGKQLIEKDFTIPIRLYNQISGSAVTNITADEAAYLAMTVGGYQFDAGQIITIPGKSIGDEFYADEDGLYEMIIDIFYESVD